MAREAMICPMCRVEMNHHADKLVYADGAVDSTLGGVVEEFHSCPKCGRTESRAG
jgi:uncharacterized protein with PIN domain